MNTLVESCASYSLSASDMLALKSMGKTVDANPYSEPELFLTQLGHATLSKCPLIEKLALFAGRETLPALLLRGLPLPHDIPVTPLESFASEKRNSVGTESLLAIVASQLGTMYTYSEWDSGQLVHNKYPIRSHRDVQFGSNAVQFLLHTETPFRGMSPDFLCLLCLRSDPNGLAKTGVANAARIVEGFSSDEQAILRQSLFCFETDNAEVFIDGVGMTTPKPILTDFNGSMRCEYVEDLNGVTEEARAVLEVMASALHASLSEVSLQFGDMLLIDNHRAVHGRNAIDPRYDGSDRWLQRVLISEHIPRDAVLDARLVHDSRFANYPSQYKAVLTEAGGDR